MKRFLILPFLYVCSLFASDILEKEIVVVIPSYNNQQWYTANVFSVILQHYEKFRIIYINDRSTDGTGESVEQLVKEEVGNSFRTLSFDDSFSDDILAIAQRFKEEVNRERAFFTLVNNVNRCGALENLYRAIHSCDDHEIIVTVDGDDWLHDFYVLEGVNAAYGSGEVWMTHGKLIEHPTDHQFWCEPVPEALVVRNAVREFKCPSHLRTFYAWIFKKIALEDLLFNGKFFPMTWDMAIMYPILEMAGERHRFINELNYVYNTANSLNDNKVNAELQRELERYIRNMPPYSRLERKP